MQQQEQDLQDLSERFSEVTLGWENYWRTHSAPDTWQFWVMLAMLIIPLVVLYFRLDRSKAFRIGFYGFSIHAIAFYIDLYATTHGMWAYPYKAFPFPPSSFALDASLIPIAYMLLYQWTLNHNKNYYLYLALLAAVFSFALKPLFSSLNLFQLQHSNYWVLFMFYAFGGLGGKWITDLFEFAQKRTVTSKA